MNIAPNLWVTRYRDGGLRIRTGSGLGRRVVIIPRAQLADLIAALDAVEHSNRTTADRT